MGPRLAQILFFSALLLVAHEFLSQADGNSIGVYYGMKGNNLPSPKDVINLYKKCRIGHIRMNAPTRKVLEALRGSGLSVTVGVRNKDIESIAKFTSPFRNLAKEWVSSYILPYEKDVSFKYITVGDELIPGPLSDRVLTTVFRIQDELFKLNLGHIKATTAISTAALNVTHPPSAGSFLPNISQTMSYIAANMDMMGQPLMVNVYPYLAYSSDPRHVSVNYTFFNSTKPVLIDGKLEYYNHFDAMVDAFHAAMEKVKWGKVRIVVGQTGWPTKGNAPFTSVANAKAYNTNLLKHVTKNGTPRRPGYLMDTFFFSMFNENLKKKKKKSEVDKNFGFFYPDMKPVYPFWPC